MPHSWKEMTSLRRLELLLKFILTGGNKFDFLCDSHIRMCYFCVLFRIKVQRISLDSFYIATRRALYIFSYTNSPLLIGVVPRSQSRGYISRANQLIGGMRK